MQMMSYPTSPEQREPPQWRRLLHGGWVYCRSGLTAILLLVVVAFAAFLLTRGPILPTVAGCVCVFLLVVGAAYRNATRRRDALRVLNYVRQAIDFNVSVPAFLVIAAADEAPPIARRLRSLAQSLDNGAPLGAAMGSELYALPEREAGLVRLADANYSLLPTLTRIDRNTDADDEPGVTITRELPYAYIVMMLVAIGAAMLVVAVFVMPRLMQIMKDFGADPREVDILRTFVTLANIWPIYLGFAALGVWVFASLLDRSSQSLFFPRDTRSTARSSSRLRKPLYYLPLVGRRIRERDWADVCQVIADGLRAARPLDLVIADAASMTHLNPVTLRRLDVWQMELRQGKPIADAARTAKLPGLITGFLGDHATQPTIEFLARSYATRSRELDRWLAALVRNMLPILFGLAVGWFAITLFKPLMKLIDLCLPYPVSL